MKTHLKNIISEAEAALAKLEEDPGQPTPENPLTIREIREGVVRAEWDPALAELPDFDIWFYTPEKHRPWQLNILMHVPDADLSQGYWEIPLDPEGDWYFEARAEGFRSGVVEFNYTQGKEDPEPEPQPEPEEPEEPVKRRVIYHGFWDHYINDSRTLPDSLLPYVNIGKSMSRTVNRITRNGLPAIMHLGNLSRENDEDRKKRIRSFPQYIPSGAEVEIIHFIDEPLGTFSGPELDELVDYAREIHGDKYKYAYTINSAELYYPGLRVHDTYAQRFDYVFHQAYPYRKEGGSSYLRNIGDTKAELFASLDLRLKTLKEKIPNSKFWMIGQGFHGQKWRVPPVKSPIWYMEWCMANDVEGLLWWKYFTTRGSWDALDKMPEHLESLKKAHEMMYE